jgi:hypothetical protein
VTYTIVLSTAIGTPLIALLNAATLFGWLPASPQDISAVLAVLLDAAINAGLGISPISTTVFALSGLAQTRISGLTSASQDPLSSRRRWSSLSLYT